MPEPDLPDTCECCEAECDCGDCKECAWEPPAPLPPLGATGKAK